MKAGSYNVHSYVTGARAPHEYHALATDGRAGQSLLLSKQQPRWYRAILWLLHSSQYMTQSKTSLYQVLYDPADDTKTGLAISERALRQASKTALDLKPTRSIYDLGTRARRLPSYRSHLHYMTLSWTSSSWLPSAWREPEKLQK